ncbi:hypothetical protein GCM10010387_24530 [Streptomyces inusitatus]|uniref:Uncharacterized protein n=1 Tax=Streptomyces inusitatus TaxID=68221 RepID=A0A918Q2H2_9ACTN|nr:hypothetical protein [Streptomyces inusitatus]GGZ30111.1 hypothetical protein GCM10010387_24530 [Streptomyces inusitatus]
MSAGGGPGGSSVSDEEWERFLRESVDGAPGAPEEPSARARLVTRRLRENPGKPEAWRAYTPARPRRRLRLRTASYAAGLVCAIALLVVALAPGRVAGWFGGDGAGAGAGEPPAAEAEAAPRPSVEEPFRGSPAARWASGTAGITVPAARATGWMSAAQVERALGRSLDFLAASSLDPAVLRGERPERAIALINPRQQDVKSYLSTAFRAPDEKNDPLLLFSRFDDTRVRLVGDEVRTRGRITYREGERGALRVTADVTYVYPVGPAAGGDEVTRTIVRRETVLSWDDPAKVRTGPGTFSLVSYSADMTNGGCGPTTGYLTPRFGADRPAEAGAGPEVDPYDRGTPMAERMRESDGGECGIATRS